MVAEEVIFRIQANLRVITSCLDFSDLDEVTFAKTIYTLFLTKIENGVPQRNVSF